MDVTIVGEMSNQSTGERRLPQEAAAVIIGQGGIVGATVAHHLIERGWDHLVGIDKSAVPTDIGSTAHASDFCYMTSHDRMSVFTTLYSREFYESLGHYSRVGGLEVARVGDDERMEELKRKVGSAKAFGTRAELISAARAKEYFPLLEERMIQGALWDPDAGLVVPRSQRVAGVLLERAVASGRLQTFANTPALSIDIQDGRVRGVETRKGYIKTPIVIFTCGIWGPLLASRMGSPLPLMPFEHPLLFFGPFNEFAGTGKEIGYPLLRDQGNSSYMRDTGDPKTAEGGQLEWGYYEQTEPRLVYPRDIAEPGEARLSPSMRDMDIEQVMQGYERATELVPLLGELGWDAKRSFNGLMSITADGSPLVGESPEVGGLWYAEAVWVKDAPGIAKVLAEWMSTGRSEWDTASIDISRFYAVQKTQGYVYGRCFETAKKVYNPAVHPREPYLTGRDLRRGPFWPREKELGGYFMEAAGWERAHGYSSNERLLETYGDRVPERRNEWDARHFWRVSNAEQLAMSHSVGMINLSHFAIYDVSGPDCEMFLEYLSVAKVGGGTALGQGVYTHFLDEAGGVHSDLTIIRMGACEYRVVCGGSTGPRDLMWMRRIRELRGFKVQIADRSDDLVTLGLWGPEARRTLQAVADEPEALTHERFPFATARSIRVRGLPVWAFRISYVGEQGWELYLSPSYGLSLWDLLYEQGVLPVGIETYANTRRMEKSLRLQNADLLTEYNLYEAGLARAKVKGDDFHGKAAYVAQRERPRQSAYLCTLTMESNVDAKGVARYPVGQWPILDPQTREVLVDDRGRRSVITSIAYGPSVGKNIALGYLPERYAQEGRALVMEYFGEHYPLRVAGVGQRALYDPSNERPKS
jgi:glycine cleavage system aminomethyltransferase T/glycine/D-amino acid oxidase-like deaminating enzyme